METFAALVMILSEISATFRDYSVGLLVSETTVRSEKMLMSMYCDWATTKILADTCKEA